MLYSYYTEHHVLRYFHYNISVVCDFKEINIPYSTYILDTFLDSVYFEFYYEFITTTLDKYGFSIFVFCLDNLINKTSQKVLIVNQMCFLCVIILL